MRLYSLSPILVDRLAHASLLGRLYPKSLSRLSDEQILKVMRDISHDEVYGLHRERLKKEPSESGARAPDRSVCQQLMGISDSREMGSRCEDLVAEVYPRLR